MEALTNSLVVALPMLAIVAAGLLPVLLALLIVHLRRQQHDTEELATRVKQLEDKEKK